MAYYSKTSVSWSMIQAWFSPAWHPHTDNEEFVQNSYINNCCDSLCIYNPTSSLQGIEHLAEPYNTYHDEIFPRDRNSKLGGTKSFDLDEKVE